MADKRSLYVRFRQFFQPYWRPRVRKNFFQRAFYSIADLFTKSEQDYYEEYELEDELEDEIDQLGDNNKEEILDDAVISEKDAKDAKKKLDLVDIHNDVDYSTKSVLQDVPKKTFSTEYGPDDVFVASQPVNNLKIIEVKKPLDKAYLLKYKPKNDEAWYYHDKDRHQIFARFEPKSGYRHKDRDSAARRKLTALIYPKNVGIFDRTHIIPFGYHGSENDARLVIGWDSKQNRTPLNNFEQEIKALDEPIYWFTDIRRTPYGAIWRYAIFSAADGRLIKKIVLTYGDRRKPVRFFWRRN